MLHYSIRTVSHVWNTEVVASWFELVLFIIFLRTKYNIFVSFVYLSSLYPPSGLRPCANIWWLSSLFLCRTIANYEGCTNFRAPLYALLILSPWYQSVVCCMYLPPRSTFMVEHTSELQSCLFYRFSFFSLLLLFVNNYIEFLPWFRHHELRFEDLGHIIKKQVSFSSRLCLCDLLFLLTSVERCAVPARGKLEEQKERGLCQTSL